MTRMDLDETSAKPSPKTANATKLEQLFWSVENKNYKATEVILAGIAPRNLNEEDGILTGIFKTLARYSSEFPDQKDTLNSLFGQVVAATNFATLSDIQKAEILNYTVECGNIAMLHKMLTVVDVNVRDAQKRDALTTAAMTRNAQAVEEVLSTRKVRGLEGRLSDVLHKGIATGLVMPENLVTRNDDPLISGIAQNLRGIFTNAMITPLMVNVYTDSLPAEERYTALKEICDGLEANYGVVIPQIILTLARSNVRNPDHTNYDEARRFIAKIPDRTLGDQDGTLTTTLVEVFNNCRVGATGELGAERFAFAELLIGKIDVRQLNEKQVREISDVVARFAGADSRYQNFVTNKLINPMIASGFPSFRALPPFDARSNDVFGSLLRQDPPYAPGSVIAAERRRVAALERGARNLDGQDVEMAEIPAGQAAPGAVAAAPSASALAAQAQRNAPRQ